MPFVRIETNCQVSQKVIEESIAQITDKVQEYKGDPTKIISVVINTEVKVSFDRNCKKPAAVVQMLASQMNREITTKLIEDLSDILIENFAITPQRIYIMFYNFTEPHLVGWNRKTFDRITADDLKNCQ